MESGGGSATSISLSATGFAPAKVEDVDGAKNDILASGEERYRSTVGVEGGCRRREGVGEVVRDKAKAVRLAGHGPDMRQRSSCSA